MLEERGFRRGYVLTDICLGIIVRLIVCRGPGFAVGMTWSALASITIINHAGDVLGDGFVVSGKFSLLSGRYLCLLDG